MSVRLLLPTFPFNYLSIKDVFISGFVVSEASSITIYITCVTLNSKTFQFTDDSDTIHGICNPSDSCCDLNKKHSIILKFNKCCPYVVNLIVNNQVVNASENCIIVLYDYDKVKNSQTLYDSTKIFWKLHNFLLNNYEETDSTQNCSKKRVCLFEWLSSSMFAQHLVNYINLMYWLMYSCKKNKNVGIPQGNFVFTLIFDVALGYAALYFLSEDKAELNSILNNSLEKLVNLLDSLLKWLMGAPAGLKLNNAFNKMLGNFFSYHIKLWWLFLDVSAEKLNGMLHIYSYLGYMGITFQAAMIADMIYIVTFHSYCIYVYAARLFNMQISGLVALLRLFVGRKYNPLRKCVDSCEYSNQELFVGTVAFTILLLLLPTTVMYYIVFALFRLMSLLIQYGLAKMIYLIQTMPLYAVGLWTIRSPKLAGNIDLEVVNKEKEAPLVLRANLTNKPLSDIISNFRPPVQISKTIEWTFVISNLFTGKEII